MGNMLIGTSFRRPCGRTVANMEQCREGARGPVRTFPSTGGRKWEGVCRIREVYASNARS